MRYVFGGDDEYVCDATKDDEWTPKYSNIL